MNGSPDNDRDQLRSKLAALAARGVFIGTSSWKYPGWLGQVYARDRYIYRGKFSQARFERLCLAEYAETFKTVCVDAAYYQFPNERHLADWCGAVPGDFRFTFKVTEDITARRFPNLPRHGARAGRLNEHFLDAGLFARAFLEPLERHRANVGALIFEFTRFHADEFGRGRDFVAALDAFFGQLPRTWNYGVEIRNRSFLHDEYFAMLARHGVAHVFNSWADMPAIGEQWALPGSRTAEFLVARFLLKPGRTYEEAVKQFSPYDRVQEVNPEGRAAGASMIREAVVEKRRTFLHVNNRFEGNAPATIRAMIDQVGVE